MSLSFKNIRNINGGMRFLLLMISVYFIAALIDLKFTLDLLGETYVNLKNILPVILIVFLFIFLVNRFLNQELVLRYLGKESGVKGWLFSIITGILIPAPPYVIFPLLGKVKKEGARNALLVFFLYNRNLQITFLPVLAFYFGLKYTIIISVYVFIFSIISGIIMEKIMSNKN